MADQPYDPYIPAGPGGNAPGPGNQRTAAIQAVGIPILLISFFPSCLASIVRRPRLTTVIPFLGLPALSASGESQGAAA